MSEHIRPRLALLTDFPEERWPSMDLVAEQLFNGLSEGAAAQFDVQRKCARYRPCFARLPGGGRNADRLFNRLVVYPRYARRIAGDYDLFHVCDHSYSQLIHALPADRTGVFCHDLDTFRCILDPAREPRPRWFRAMARRILRGMQKARIVFHATRAVREQIVQYGLIDPARLVQAPLGVASEFFARPGPEDPGAMPAELASIGEGGGFLLHVGSCIPRKRIDVLLDVFASVRATRPEMKLIQVGGEFTGEQRRQLDALKLGDAVIQVRGLTRGALARLYRSAIAVLVTSEAEGFGLPVAEALASGAVVVASDLPVLREVGEDAAVYAPVGDIAAWAAVLQRVIDDPGTTPSVSVRAARAAQFSWSAHAAIIADAYAGILPGRGSH